MCPTKFAWPVLTLVSDLFFHSSFPNLFSRSVRKKRHLLANLSSSRTMRGCFVPLTPPLFEGEPYTDIGRISLGLVWFGLHEKTARHCPSRLSAGKELRNA
ncbi:hypothetical protein K0M31_009838 [Melipona bicolor]|uniref:Uncharacterized protein n=1 Tax=Melipona bicolor TaxID=60889 RepID=A0AA40FMT7_9HYME|nr:hypothetical protein K0M31_009838 [Melipona bicolor]